MKKLFNFKLLNTQNLLSKITRSIFFLFSILYILHSVSPASALTTVTTSSAGDIRSGLIGYWTFDGKNMTNATATDSSGSGVDGALTNSPKKTIGKIGQALQLNGTNSYVDMGTTTTLRPTFPFSISVWVKLNSLAPTSFGSPIITSSDVSTNGQYTGFSLTVDSTGAVYLNIGPGGGCCDPAFRSTFITSAGAVTTGKWYHIAAVATAYNTMSIYVNGVLQGGAQSGSATTMVYPSTSRFRVGAVYEANSLTTVYTNGLIDDVRLYNRALSLKEAQALYKAGGGTIAAVAPGKSSNGSNTTGINSGLAGYWTFDGTNMTNATATDVSGRGNNGALTNMTTRTSSATGKIGQSLRFDGVDDFISASSTAGVVYNTNNPRETISFWVKAPSQNVKYIYSESGNSGGNTGFHILSGPPSDCCNPDRGGKLQILIVATNFSTILETYTNATVFDNTWHHVVWVDDNGTASVYIDGVRDQASFNYATTSIVSVLRTTIAANEYNTVPRNYFNGLLDDFRVYNRTLSPTEIQSLYKAGGGSVAATNPSNTNNTGINSGLVGYWTFDGKNITNATATDISGNGNNGTLKNSPKTAIGKIGQGFRFDGVDDYVTIPYSTSLNPSNITISYWVKENATPDVSDTIISGKHSSGDISYFSDMRGASNRNPTFGTYVGGVNHFVTSQTSLVVGKWYHIVGTFNGSIYIIYVNGVLDNTLPDSTPLYSGASRPLSIGNLDNNGVQERFFNGTIDDVRVYNRALTAKEVQALYRLGSQQ